MGQDSRELRPLIVPDMEEAADISEAALTKEFQTHSSAGLPLHDKLTAPGSGSRGSHRSALLSVVVLVFKVVFSLTVLHSALFRQWPNSRSSVLDDVRCALGQSYYCVPMEAGQAVCPQVPAYTLPSSYGGNHSSSIGIKDAQLPSADELARLLSGAVQVDTSVGDGWPAVSQDPERWEAVFGPFRAYLRSALPRLHAPDSPVQLELVNSHGLLYTWPGSDASLKPILFMAHQDVVPVEPETVSAWTHPPFSGFIDEKLGLIWGRGASDTKTSLVAILATMQSLMDAGFVPKRTIVCSFGFDEESAGTEGGEQLAKFINQRYGDDGVAMIVDEGGEIMRADASGLNLGIPVAAPAVAEKGYLDAKITVKTPGGHSSEPSDHTSIGYLAQLITALESNPYQPYLDDTSPALQFLQCTRDAPKANHKLSNKLRELQQLQLDLDFAARMQRAAVQTKKHKHLDKVKKQILALLDRTQLFSFQTTQAVDLISGGVKVNALPEQASVVVNHRIDITSSTRDVRQHIYNAILKVARRHNLKIVPGEHWEDVVKEGSAPHSNAKSVGEIVLQDAFESALEPAPRTPLGTAKPWTLLQSVIRATWSDILVAPDLMGGNTDTKSYWNVSTNIFRFSPGSDKPFPIPGQGENIHTVDERSTVDGIEKAAHFYSLLMQAASHEDL